MRYPSGSLRIQPDHLNLPLLQGLAALPLLVELSIDVNSMANDVVTRLGFKMLQTLRIDGEIFTTMRFLSMISSPFIHTFSVDIAVQEDAESLRSLSAMIAAKFPSLCNLQFRATGFGAEDLPLSAIIESLMSLRSLRVIDLTPLKGMSLSNQELVDMASAWPDAEVLSIWGTATSVDAGHVLTAFARLCPNLKDFSLPYLNFDALPSPDSLSNISAVGHCLRTLRFNALLNDSVPDPSAAAHFLDVIFPELDLKRAIAYEVDVKRDFRSPDESRWKKVLELLASLRRDREHRLDQVESS
ncbi:hypothetical protein SCP_0410600 [Sparassis crispa]|uniref:F-box domain-containing protein n=1 Tax=Sparassis crispa TaxID=139825 RepID=A0A401GKI2_9APHY|nr:hypothetical protein SCP_0410600 [Sparassis crispa]GBE82675.1 hypothetical protein SCP_0410600 [Sparassis crispa]